MWVAHAEERHRGFAKPSMAYRHPRAMGWPLCLLAPPVSLLAPVPYATVYQSITHVALKVANVEEAEEYYHSLLGLTVAFRDVQIEGEWYGLRSGYDWRAADGCELAVSVLGNGPLNLALESGDAPANGRLNHVGLRVSLGVLDELRIRAVEHEAAIVTNRSDLLVFEDRYHIRWEVGIAAYDNPAAMGTGARTGRWWPVGE